MAALPSVLTRLAPALLAVALLAAQARLPARQEPQASAPAGGPRRIVSLVPSTTEMLFLMGAGERVAAVGSYDHFPPDVERLPRVGGLLDPDIEQLIALRPDLVIVYETQVELRQQLERARIPAFLYTHRDLADIVETMRALGARVGVGPAADRAAVRIEQQLAAIRARVANARRPRTLLVFSREPGSLRQVTASGGYGFLHDVLELAGGEDVLGDVRQQSVTMSTEMILARAPEVIIELHYGPSAARTDADNERRVWNALPSLPAVKTGRIYLLTGDEFVIPGPRIGQAAARVAAVLHPPASGR